MLRRACDKLEMPDIDLDKNLGEDYFSSGEKSNPANQDASSNAIGPIPTMGDKIYKEFKGGDVYEGKVESGPRRLEIDGMDVPAWMVEHTDGDIEEMTAAEIEYW